MQKSPQRHSSKSILQLRVTLRDVEPPIWRRLLVSDSTTLTTFHAILQDTMGWENYHLYQFTVAGADYEAPDPEATGRDASQIKLKDLPLKIGSTFEYIYDFGDDWYHDIVLEDRLAVEPDLFYPQCIGGARACPPEDCGGPWRYTEVLEILHNPEHPEFQELTGWIGDFQPEAFDIRLINRILMLAFARGAV